jgi:hypothetical protein
MSGIWLCSCCMSLLVSCIQCPVWVRSCCMPLLVSCIQCLVWLCSCCMSLLVSSIQCPEYGYVLVAGHSWLADGSQGYHGDETHMWFPWIQTTSTTYLKFEYQMYGADVGSLEARVVHYTDPEQAEVIATPWKLSGNQGNFWDSECFQLFPEDQDQVKLFFVAVHGDGPLSYIAIDDIELTEEPCLGTFRIRCVYST